MSMCKNFILIYPPIYPRESFSSYMPGTLIVPLGGLYLADALIKNGYSIAIIDYETIEDTIRKIDFLIGTETIAFGISSLSGTQLSNGLAIARHLREHYRKIPIIWGGAHATAIPRQTLENEFVDFIVWGEGEGSIVGLLDCIKTGKKPEQIKGIGYKNNGVGVITDKSDYTHLKETFELPYYLLDMNKYARKMNIGLDKCHTVLTSRGCPFRCKFCSNSSSIWPNTKMRYHSIKHIIKEIALLINNYGADGITFGDENFFVEEKRIVSICEALVAENFKIKYRAGGRADLLSRLKSSTWDLLKKTGFVGISVGIETGSQRMLDFMGKGITLEQIFKVDSLLTEYSFFKTYNFLTCLPTETVDDIKMTLKLIIDLAKNSLYCPFPFGTLSKFIPLPGTEMCDIAKKHGFIPPNSMQGWTIFDFKEISEMHNITRPWISKEIINFLSHANRLIEELNALFIGRDINRADVLRKIEEISKLIALKNGA